MFRNLSIAWLLFSFVVCSCPFKTLRFVSFVVCWLLFFIPCILVLCRLWCLVSFCNSSVHLFVMSCPLLFVPCSVCFCTFVYLVLSLLFCLLSYVCCSALFVCKLRVAYCEIRLALVRILHHVAIQRIWLYIGLVRNSFWARCSVIIGVQECLAKTATQRSSSRLAKA